MSQPANCRFCVPGQSIQNIVVEGLLTPRDDLVELKQRARDRGLTADELREIETLGTDGLGIWYQIDELNLWLERHPRL